MWEIDDEFLVYLRSLINKRSKKISGFLIENPITPRLFEICLKKSEISGWELIPRRVTNAKTSGRECYVFRSRDFELDGIISAAGYGKCNLIATISSSSSASVQEREFLILPGECSCYLKPTRDFGANFSRDRRDYGNLTFWRYEIW